MSKLVKAFGEAVRQCRTDRSMSQEELGGLAGIHRTYVGMIERGEKNITLDNIAKVAKAFGMSPSTLLRQTEGRL